MKTKIKAAYFFMLSLILIATIGLIIYQIRIKSDSAKNLEQQNTSNEIRLASNIKNTKEAKIISEVSQGEVISRDKEIIRIGIDNKEFLLKLTNKTAVYSINEGNVEKKKIDDISVGSEIKFEYNTEGNEAISIKIK